MSAINSMIFLGYTCPQCGYHWGDAIDDDSFVGTCDCPNCEVSVAAKVVN